MTHDAIARRAQEIAKRRGGRLELEDWLQAARELRREAQDRPSSSGSASGNAETS